jgi:glyoxylase-like metal-dependent hydrolase (beta-lactamase superfamily II)
MVVRFFVTAWIATMIVRTNIYAGLFALVMSGSATAQSAPHQEILSVHDLGDDAYWVEGGVANSGFIVGDKGVIVIDAQMFMPAAKAELAQIAKITPKPVEAIILTHSDPDHINGVPVYSRGAEVIAQTNAKAEILQAIADPKSNGMPPPPEMKDYIPSLAVDHNEHVVRDGVQLVLLHVAPAHTDGDLVVYLPDKKIVFAGDLLTPAVGPWPGIHLNKRGSSLGWIEFAKAMLALDADVFVSGHGEALTRAQVADRVRRAEQRRAEIKVLFEQHKSLAEAKAILSDKALPGLAARFPTFVETTYQELEAGQP